MTITPYRICNLDLNNVCYTDIKSNSKKTIIYLKYMDNMKLKNIVFQTPAHMSTNMIQCKNNIFELDVPLVGKEIKTVSLRLKSLSDRFPLFSLVIAFLPVINSS